MQRTGDRRTQMAASDHQEIEWQFDALDARPVARWLDGLSSDSIPYLVLPSGEKEISDVYLDTEDWRVYRAGYALRLRRREGREPVATMKLLSSPAGDGPRTRREISDTLPDGSEPSAISASDGPVGDRIKSLCGRDQLTSLFEVRTRRKTYAVETAHSEDEDSERETSLAEVALDDTEIPVGEGRPVVLTRVEVEVERGDASAFAPFVEQLTPGRGLTPATASKFEAGLMALELSPPEPPHFGETEVSKEMSVGELAFAVLREQFEVFLSHEPGTRIGEDPEELHDMRVASRRSRAAMKVFREALPVRSAHLEEQLKWIAGVLGEVRDLDVQLEQLEEWISSASPEDRQPLSELRAVLRSRRDKARRQMLRSLDSQRYIRFVEGYGAFLTRGPSRRAIGSRRPVLEMGPEIVTRPYRKVRKAGDRISKGSSPEEYHELRKRGKRLRYTLEFFTGIYGKPVREMISSLKTIQDVLGDHQDAEVAVEHLRDLAATVRVTGRAGAENVSPLTVFTMGAIANRYAAMAAGLRGEFPSVYGNIKGKPWRRLRRAMEKTKYA